MRLQTDRKIEHSKSELRSEHNYYSKPLLTFIRFFNRLSTRKGLILLPSVGTVGKVSRGRMQTAKFITGICSLLAAGSMLVAAVAYPAFADESFTPSAPGLLDPPPPSLTRQSSGFELETPAEPGARPIGRGFILSAPKPVAPFPIQMSRYVKRYL